MKKGYFWASAFYLTYFAAAASYIGYLIVYYQKSEITMAQIGILAGLPTIMSLIANPIWSMIADAWNLHARLLPITIFLTLPLYWMVSQTQSFSLLVVEVLLFSFSLAPIVSLADYSVLSMLGENRYHYGKLRIWGAVGFGLSSWAVGLLTERVGIQISFKAFLLFMTLTMLIATQLPKPKLERTEPFWLSVRKLATDRRWYAFLAALLLVGMSFSILNNYFILVIKQLGGGEGLFGLSVAVAGVGELPVFFFSGWALRRWKPRQLVMAAIGITALRFLYVGLVSNPWLVFWNQILHGLSFSLLWTAGVNYANELAPKGLGASAQALFSATLFGLGGGVGAFVGSQIIAVSSAQTSFLFAAAAASISFMILLFFGREQPLNIGVKTV